MGNFFKDAAKIVSNPVAAIGGLLGGGGGGGQTTVNPTSTVAVTPQVSLTVPPADFAPLAAAMSHSAELQATSATKTEERVAQAASSQTFIMGALLLFTLLFFSGRE